MTHYTYNDERFLIMISELFKNTMADIGELLAFALFIGGALGAAIGLLVYVIRNIKEIKEEEKNDSKEGHMARTRAKYKVSAQEVSIDCCGLSFLTICGTHINGAYAVFPGYGVSAELSVNDVSYNKKRIFEALRRSGDSWLPDSDDALREMSGELSEVITTLLNGEVD